MLHTKPVTKNIKYDKEGFHHIKALYGSAFPRQEQAPLGFLINQTKKDTVRFDAYYDGDVFVGLTYTISSGDMTYLWYLATRSDLRSKGYGSQIMQHLRELYPNNRIALNLDAQDETASDSEIRKKRKEFYIRNGYTPTGYLCMFHGNRLDVMSINGNVTSNEFLSIFRDYFGPIMYFFARPKIISQQ
ncbi:MAG: GNAT family N-acetyltransferase [Oscillospiraceae bacterium]|nr:GNAT family N-acetyltransferase [Oscillospiraceae bacterium]